MTAGKDLDMVRTSNGGATMMELVLATMEQRRPTMEGQRRTMEGQRQNLFFEMNFTAAQTLKMFF